MAGLLENYLFRAREKKHKKWHIGLLAVIDNVECCIRDNTNLLQYCDPETICPCSGLHDFRDTLIFAEDIIRDDDGRIGVVKYGEYDHSNGQILGWYIEWKSEKALFYRQDFLFWQSQREIEVIGNTFDNADILSDLTRWEQRR